MKQLFALLVLVAAAFAQDGNPVSTSSGPPFVAYQSLFYYSGANLIYACYAKSTQARASTITVSAASNANPVSFTATAHGLGDYAGIGASTMTIQITGGTGNWTAINGVWVATTTSANAFTIAVDSTAFGALTGTLVVTTKAPRWNQNMWSVLAQTFSGSNQLTRMWAVTSGGAGSTALNGGTTGADFKCSDRATLGYQ